MSHAIKLVPLNELKENPINPKTHDNGLITKSISTFGYVEPIVIDERTGFMISGHGRKESLELMQINGDVPPAGITVDNGMWLVPVVTGWSSKDDTEAHATLVALNRTTEKGGWDNENLLTILKEMLANNTLDIIGYAETDIAMLERMLEAEGTLRQDVSDAVDEFVSDTGVDIDGRVSHFSTMLRVYFQTEEARQEFFNAIEYKNEGKKQNSIRYPKTFVREKSEEWNG